MSTRDYRLDLQPGTKIQYSNIDPSTGYALDGSYRVYNSDGSPVRVDGNGNVIFTDISFNDPAFASKSFVKFDPKKTTVNISSVKQILSTEITELGTRRDTIITDGPFGDLCNIIRDILDGEDRGTEPGGGISINGNPIGDPGGGVGPGGDGTYQDLLELIARVEDELQDCRGYQIALAEVEARLEACTQELEETVDSFEDLLDVVNALKACKDRLERALDKKDAIIQSLGADLKNSEELNAALVDKVRQQEVKIQDLLKIMEDKRNENDKELLDGLTGLAETNQAIKDALVGLEFPDININNQLDIQGFAGLLNQGGGATGGGGTGSTTPLSGTRVSGEPRSLAIALQAALPDGIKNTVGPYLLTMRTTTNAQQYKTAFSASQHSIYNWLTGSGRGSGLLDRYGAMIFAIANNNIVDG